MARLDIRVDGRTRLSRTVDDGKADAILAAAVAVLEPKKVVRNFGGKVVRTTVDEPKRTRRPKPEPGPEDGKADTGSDDTGSD